MYTNVEKRKGMIHKGIVSLMVVLLIVLPSCGSRVSKRPNILLVTIDTLRRDHLGAYGYPRETSPFIDSLAREGVMFEHVVTPQPQTSGSHASILTSLHPLSHDLIFNTLPLNDNIQTIAEVLKKNGYYTIGTVGVKLLTKKYNFSQGFDSFSDEWKKHPEYKFEGNSQRIAQWVNESLFEQIREYRTHHQDKPLFIWVHYYDPHSPYIGRDHIIFNKKLPGETETDERIKRYDQEIRYTDDAIRQLHRFLEKNGLSRDLVTCITADHGEEFGEHYNLEGHTDFYSPTTLVPLIFHGSGIPRHLEIDNYVSTTDIATTLLGRLNLAFDYTTDGIDLLKGIEQAGAGSLPDRKFLVIGTQKFCRSLQMLGPHYSFILNFDYHYKFWYISTHTPSAPTLPIPESRFKPFSPAQITVNKNRTTVTPDLRKIKGVNYIVLRADTLNRKQNNRLVVKVETYPRFYSNLGFIPLSSPTPGTSKPQTVEIIYPVTVVDRLDIHLVLQGLTGAELENPRYVIIPAQEFHGFRLVKQAGGVKKRMLSRIWKMMITPRKNTRTDELFDLSTDIGMNNNLIKKEHLKPVILEYKKLIYNAYDYFSKKGKRLQKGAAKKKKMTAEDEKTLKSLGYL
jgi:arylsulfatase A-like enzyme